MSTKAKQALMWAGYKFASTVLDDIWPEAFFFTVISVMVVCVGHFTTVNLGINSTMLSVLGTVVSLVVSFKTNNSYSRWWDGRNLWSDITSNSRQLATLIWLHVDNVNPDPKDNEKGNDNPQNTRKEQGTPMSDVTEVDEGDPSHPVRKWHKKGQHADPAINFLDHQVEAEKQRAAEAKRQQTERATIEGLIEKKTYIGLVQAFAIAMKHCLRGEEGPFYSDLYSLIAFLPKYNPAALPPIQRQHVMTLWQNGLPRQKAHKCDDVVAIPLTQPASWTGYAFGIPNDHRPDDVEVQRNHKGELTTASERFKTQAITSATSFTRTNDPTVYAFSTLAKNRLVRSEGKTEEGGEKVHITTVELMPPRHPPPATWWDFCPPLRVIKRMADWFKTKQRLERMERTKGGKRRRSGGVKSEIPQEILMYLSAYVADLMKKGALNGSISGPIMGALGELHKAMSDLEKIATTPIPSAYSFHLRLTVWAYLFFLPFQLYSLLGWVTIPATAVAAVTYLGFLEIGAQIEMPFAYDQSDLNMDSFVLKITEQLAEVTAFPTHVPTSHVVMSHLNQPFLPTLKLSAPELMGVNEIVPGPTNMGFAASFEAQQQQWDASASQERPLPKSVRDLEIALGDNWREVGSEMAGLLVNQSDQLENKTGLEVAVIVL
ncbi:Bestrophin, RFP-TM, chloride channel-domain-containing protein [Naematelia encephala]|uniref:Bestrophin, RFP-TM, chloride channel-domain-containing protein n=1 Tax=Naematelia encephala TaxID=71784 RepID=A0A1Y2ADE6_9TREE|nr:Bestrophin, RFP-TM, chloride channel-domain-containing protein [Naematelia encephala]